MVLGGDVLLEIAVGAAARHRADRTHAAIGLVRAALIEEHLARAFSGPGQHRSDHHRARPRGHCLGDIAAGAKAPIRDHRNVGFSRLGRAFTRGSCPWPPIRRKDERVRPNQRAPGGQIAKAAFDRPGIRL